jgi:hypothetical protein
LSDADEELHFGADGPFFRAEQEGAQVIKCRKLDGLNLEVIGRPLIKIDIEGSEMKALRGAKDFIEKYKPYLAVCVYHKEKDIFELPEYIKELYSGYRIYLRGGVHTVCYCVPE